MTIHSDILSALATVAGGRIYADAAPEKAPLPLVIYRRTHHEPIQTLVGEDETPEARSVFVFECWGKSSDAESAKASALSTAQALVTAMNAASAIQIKRRVPVHGEEFEPQTLEVMEPVSYSFWHTE